VKELMRYVRNGKKRVPVEKKVVLMMAYARNGRLEEHDHAEALQIPVYLLAYDDPRVIAITMFSYGRRSGTREHPS